MVFVDSNIPMYLIGTDHPHKQDVRVHLKNLAAEKVRLVTNTEVLQEILHRYTSLNRKRSVQLAFDVLYGFIDEVIPIMEQDIMEAKGLVYTYENLSARDAVHAAQMKRLGIQKIFSFDKGFENLPNLHRIPVL